MEARSQAVVEAGGVAGVEAGGARARPAAARGPGLRRVAALVLAVAAPSLRRPRPSSNTRPRGGGASVARRHVSRPRAARGGAWRHLAAGHGGGGRGGAAGA